MRGWKRRGAAGDGYRYGAWHGGRDPLEPPFDVRAAVDELGRDMLEGRSAREALRDLLSRGADGRRGLRDIRRQVQRERRRLQRGRLDGTLDRVRQVLDQTLAAEREALGHDPSDDARLAELSLDSLPPDTAGAVRELSAYDWRSPQARAGYEQIRDLLRNEVLDAQFAGMKQLLQNGDPAAMQGVRDMLADLNALLADHARGDDTQAQFDDFMDRHGDFFPDRPANVDELIDALARRQAAAARLMRSLSSQQRAELAELMEQALGDVDLESQLAQLRDNLSALRPGTTTPGPPADFGSGEPLDYSDGVGALADLADLEALDRQLGQDYPGSTLDDIDVEALERQLSPAVVEDVRALQSLEAELERQGYLRRDGSVLSLTPKALRRLGETALRRIFTTLDAPARGSHDDPRSGAADERTGAYLPWQFGDESPIDAVRTVQNAVLRRAVRTGAGDPDDQAALAVDDFVVAETERRTSAAVALCVDLSFSMIQEDRWAPMKQTALALAHLIATRYRTDALQIIGFDRNARRLSPLQLAEVEPEWVQGTNLQHALMLAGRHVRRHPDAEPVVMIVTDGEPTAHLEPDGSAFFHWPPIVETLEATVGEVDALTRFGATLNFFLLGDDPGLARFVDAVARRNGGRVFTPELDRLGEYVVADYLRTRRGRRRSA
jgi:uncharacterized protein with von Willebrand factor type A (vWA) domain